MMPRGSLWHLLALPGALVLAGCTVGPDYSPP